MTAMQTYARRPEKTYYCPVVRTVFTSVYVQRILNILLKLPKCLKAVQEQEIAQGISGEMYLKKNSKDSP